MTQLFLDSCDDFAFVIFEDCQVLEELLLLIVFLDELCDLSQRMLGPRAGCDDLCDVIQRVCELGWPHRGRILDKGAVGQVLDHVREDGVQLVWLVPVERGAFKVQL